jgi:hypothetical protein
MTNAAWPAGGTAAQLRQAFDASFAEPLREATVPPEAFLAIRVDADPHALRLADVASLLPLDAVTPLPSPLPELLGVIGHRGAVLPVYDLRTLLGYPGAAAPRWCVVLAAAPLALAFDGFDGHLRVPRQHGERLDVLQLDGQVRPVVPTAALLATLTAAAQRCAALTV